MEDLKRVFPPLQPRKKILNIFCSFVLLSNIRDKKIKSWTHPASPINESNPLLLLLLLLSHLSHLTTLLSSYLSHLPHYPQKRFPPSQLTMVSPFPPFQFISLPLFQHTTFQTTNRSLQSEMLPSRSGI